MRSRRRKRRGGLASSIATTARARGPIIATSCASRLPRHGVMGQDGVVSTATLGRGHEGRQPDVRRPEVAKLFGKHAGLGCARTDHRHTPDEPSTEGWQQATRRCLDQDVDGVLELQVLEETLHGIGGQLAPTDHRRKVLTPQFGHRGGDPFVTHHAAVRRLDGA
jgi:hypothetical protein